MEFTFRDIDDDGTGELLPFQVRSEGKDIVLFNSYVFLLLLIVTLIIYYTLLHYHFDIWAKGWLIFVSGVFYGYFEYRYIILLIGSVLWNYHIGLQLLKKANKYRMIVGILGNVFLLFYFKYTNFFLTNLNQLFHNDFSLLQILMPLGISFMTFQQIAYLVDAYHQRVEAYSLVDFTLSTVYFPKISQGPITYHQSFIPQLHEEKRHRISYRQLSIGLYLFTLGLAKKVLLADVFGQFVDYGYSHDLNSTSAILVMLAYTMQIYFDFSGYSDMARGISKMLRIDLTVNFNSPYKAMNIQDFWSRWHMSLTHFLTHYVYIPLGGNRKGARRTTINILVVFMVSGIWHGANWTFIVWGLMHGIWSVIQRQFKAFFNQLHPAFNWILTFSFVNIAWIFFRSEDIHQALHMLKLILSFNIGSVPLEMLRTLLLPEITFVLNHVPFPSLLRIIPYVVLFGSILMCLALPNTNEKSENYHSSFGKMITVGILLFWCITSFSSITTFIYFDF